jgi:putative chitinase
MILTSQQLIKAMPKIKNSELWATTLNKYLPQYGIDTKEEVSAYLAQCGHESLDFNVLEENLRYSSEGLLKVFGKYYKTEAEAKAHAKQPQKIANRVYGNRMGNGDEASGDGYKYRGRGLIMITGKNNYTALSTDLKKPEYLTNPDLLIQVEGAILSSVWFWKKNKLDLYDDRTQDFVKLSSKVNGGSIGIDDRIDRRKAAILALS